MRKRRVGVSQAIATFLVIVSVGFTGLAVAQADAQELRIGLEIRGWGTFDPHFATAGVDNTVIQPIFEGLTSHPPGRFDEIVPGLAERWESSEDGLVWTFFLKQNVEWHGGFGEFTADDVAFSFNRLMSDELASPYQTWLPLDEVEVVDTYTVRLHLNASDPSLLLKLINYRGGNMLSRAAVEHFGSDVATNPIGTGPFQLSSYVPSEEVVLIRNDAYHGDRPHLDSVRLLAIEDRNALDSAMQTGAIDMAGGTPDPLWVQRWDNLPQVVDILGPSSIMRIYVNTSMAPMDDLRVRQAIAHAINREELNASLNGDLGTTTYSVVPAEYFGGTDDVTRYEYDPERARALLAEAGYADGLSITNYISEQQQMVGPMIVVQEYLRQVGVDLQLEVIEHPTYHEYIREDRNSLIYYGGARLDASTFLQEFHLSDSIAAFSRTTALDADIRAALMEADVGDQQAQLAEVLDTIAREVHAIPLAARAAAVVVRQPWVDLGYTPEATLTVFYQITPSIQLRR